MVIGTPSADKRNRVGLLERIAYIGLSWLTGTRLSPEPIAMAVLGREAALYLLSRPNADAWREFSGHYFLRRLRCCRPERSGRVQ